MLWSYCTISRTTIGETPFSLDFGMEAIIPLETEVFSFRTLAYIEVENEKALRGELDLIVERTNET